MEAENALAYGERMVANWLEKRMFKGNVKQAEEAADTAKYFNDAGQHKSHGRRIGRDEARDQGVIIEDLEDDQGLQELALTAYHLMTIMYEQSPCVKMIWSDHGKAWIKNQT